MTIAHFRAWALRPALSLLPAAMTSPEAEAFVLAACLQESRLIARRQLGGPARGYAQWELGGVSGVLRHERTSAHAEALCEALDVPPIASSIHAAMEYQDVLCAGFARLLVWTAPWALPKAPEVSKAWDQYLWLWRPGKPKPATWPEQWERAWDEIRATR